MIATNFDYLKMFGIICSEAEGVIAKCACVSCNSCTCACSCRMLPDNKEIDW